MILINQLWELRQQLPMVLYLYSMREDFGGKTVEALLPVFL